MAGESVHRPALLDKMPGKVISNDAAGTGDQCNTSHRSLSVWCHHFQFQWVLTVDIESFRSPQKDSSTFTELSSASSSMARKEVFYGFAASAGLVLDEHLWCT